VTLHIYLIFQANTVSSFIWYRIYRADTIMETEVQTDGRMDATKRKSHYSPPSHFVVGYEYISNIKIYGSIGYMLLNYCIHICLASIFFLAADNKSSYFYISCVTKCSAFIHSIHCFGEKTIFSVCYIIQKH